MPFVGSSQWLVSVARLIGRRVRRRARVVALLVSRLDISVRARRTCGLSRRASVGSRRRLVVLSSTHLATCDGILHSFIPHRRILHTTSGTSVIFWARYGARRLAFGPRPTSRVPEHALVACAPHCVRGCLASALCFCRCFGPAPCGFGCARECGPRVARPDHSHRAQDRVRSCAALFSRASALASKVQVVFFRQTLGDTVCAPSASLNITSARNVSTIGKNNSKACEPAS